MRLNAYQSTYQHKKNIFIRVTWYLCNELVFCSPFFASYALKIFILRAFGAEIGLGVVIKPRVRVKYPWNLSVGDSCWIGEGVWIDNLDSVEIGDNCCVSQGVYICCGSHDYRKETFDLITKSISIHEEVWIGAKSIILGGSKVRKGVVVSAGTVVSGDVSEDLLITNNFNRSISR